MGFMNNWAKAPVLFRPNTPTLKGGVSEKEKFNCPTATFGRIGAEC